MSKVDKQITGREPDNEAHECAICHDLGSLKPNEQTVAAIRELREGGGVVLTGNISDLLAELNEEKPDR